MNDIQRAINGMKGFYMILEPLLLKANYEEKGKEDVAELKEDIGLAITALEKQIPKKPAETFTDGAFKRPYNICPVCESYVDRVYHRGNCGKCSQRLDWSVEE